jgi:hypothetical protein
MDDEQRDEILRTAYDTLDRLAQRDVVHDVPESGTKVATGHFDPVRAAMKRRAVEPEPPGPDLNDDPDVVYSEPIITRSALAVVDDGFWAAVDQRINAIIEGFIKESVGPALGEALKASERTQSRALHAELGALKCEVAKLENLLEALRAATQSDRAKIIDLPSMPLRRNDVN